MMVKALSERFSDMNETPTFDGRALAGDIQAEVEFVTDSLKSMSRDDYREAVASMKPGDTMPTDDGKLKTDAYKARLKGMCDDAAGRIGKLCERAERVARDEMTTPPDPGALAYCRALADREGADVDEVSAALDRYGDNWTCYQVLLDCIHKRRQDGDKEFYKLQPRNTLDGYKDMVQGMRREATTYLEQFVAPQRFDDWEHMDRRTGNVSMALGYMADNQFDAIRNPRNTDTVWQTFERGMRSL